MAGELTVNTDRISLVDPAKAEVYDFVATAAIGAGEAVYQLATGKVGVADANGSGTLQFRGIALRAAAAGQIVPVLKKGRVYGYAVSAVDCDSPLYLSDTAGDIATSAGSTSINVGRVVALPDSGNLTRVVYIDADWLRTWA